MMDFTNLDFSNIDFGELLSIFTGSLGGAAGKASVMVAAYYLINVICSIIGYIVDSFLRMKIFRKAGLDAWKAWVPYYSQWKTYQIAGLPGWVSLFEITKLVNMVLSIFNPFTWILKIFELIPWVSGSVAAYSIGKKLQKPAPFVILYALDAPIIPIIGWPFKVIWLAILAFNKSTWDDVAGPFRCRAADAEIAFSGAINSDTKNSYFTHEQTMSTTTGSIHDNLQNSDIKNDNQETFEF
jgi:hypothetical protein